MSIFAAQESEGKKMATRCQQRAFVELHTQATQEITRHISQFTTYRKNGDMFSLVLHIHELKVD